jgi:hypothetical protein
MAILAELGIQLEAVCSLAQGQAEGGQGVFRGMSAGAPVSEYGRPWQARVHGNHCKST